MRSQAHSIGASQSATSDQQKKSVFDRLGRQVESSSHSMKRRGSPGTYANCMPPMHPGQPPPQGAESDYYGRPEHPVDMEWYYHNERRHNFQEPPHQGYMFDMDSGRQQQGPPPSYYPQAHPYSHQGPPQPPPMSSTNGASLYAHPSSKCDRHGNPLPPARRLMSDMSPPRSNLLPPSNGPHMHVRGNGAPEMHMYPQLRWDEEMIPDRMLPGGLLTGNPRRPMPPITDSLQASLGYMNQPEQPRYTKWKERRDVITNLDRETAQSSSRTDSLKSSLQQPISHMRLADGSHRFGGRPGGERHRGGNRRGGRRNREAKRLKLEQKLSKEMKDSKQPKEPKEPKEVKVKIEPQEISDGEIIDDDDDDSSDDDSDTMNKQSVASRANPAGDDLLFKRPRHDINSNHHQHQFRDPSKKRHHESNESVLDYETISDDEDLDDFMADKNLAQLDDSAKSVSEDAKINTEMELLNALGLDWGNLVEKAKRSKNSNKDSAVSSVLLRFSPSNYLPTLCIDAELVGPEIEKLIETATRF